ncbi:RNA polymerase sigma factor [Nibrella viscosa]|uniref:RNA polymerase sigma factor n=1 Tax=Nibrella viscosa TaxID=1084524 RepID=A0ABP8KRT4_9BACT
MKLSYTAQESAHRLVKETDEFDQLYKQYVGRVYKQCLSFTKDSNQAEDFTHDIFMKVYARIADFKQQSAVSTWLYSITRNHCLDQLKSRKYTAESPLAEDMDYAETPTEDDRMTRLQAFINTLPAEEVQLLRLKYEQQVTCKELARQFNLTESAVKMRLKRLKEKVMTLYEQSAME